MANVYFEDPVITRPPHIRAAVWTGILTKCKITESKGLTDLVVMMKTGRPFTEVLAKTVAIVTGNDQIAVAEAKKIFAELIEPGKSRYDEAVLRSKTEPVEAFLIAETIQPLYKGTKLAQQAETLVVQLKQKPQVQLELKARVFLEQIRKIDAVLMTMPGSFNPKDQDYQLENSTSIQTIYDTYDLLFMRYPMANATLLAYKIVAKYSTR